MAWSETPENEASKQALVHASLLVLGPGLLFVLGLIWLVMLPYQLPPQDWADGTYVNACCAPLVLQNGTASAGGRSTHYVVEQGKITMQLSIPGGIGVRGGKVEFVDSYIRAGFPGSRSVRYGKPAAVELLGIDDHRGYVFFRQK